jgi:CubicO group peptidase (beta-lactamase class C family)
MGRIAAILLALTAFALLATSPAEAAKQCTEPGADWQRATPAEAGMDAAKLQDALDYGTANLGFSVRVYRWGCLVGEDRAAPANRDTRFESWSMAKSVTSLVFGRAMTMGVVSPDDPVGSLVPEADKAHGALTLENLLTQSSGLLWNGFRDYNVFTNNRDRLRDALTLPPVHPPGTYFEYAQSPVALLAEATARSTAEDFVTFAQRELMGPLGIEAGTWDWTRDNEGRVLGYMGVQMMPDDYGRLGELLRRDGVWRGRQLLSHEYVERATSASATSGCYGWLIWTNDGQPCVGVRITDRSVDDAREYPDLPADMYNFSGLFGQLVTVFPAQGIVVVRTGQDRGLVFAGGTSWEHDLYAKVLAAIADQKITPPGPAPKGTVDRSNPDYGFQQAWQHPDEYDQGLSPDPLPPAGPVRARAVRLSLARAKATRRGVVAVRVACPPVWPAAGRDGCFGSAKLEGSRKALRYGITPGKQRVLRFALKRLIVRRLTRAGQLDLALVATDTDDAGGTVTKSRVTARSPR